MQKYYHMHDPSLYRAAKRDTVPIRTQPMTLLTMEFSVPRIEEISSSQQQANSITGALNTKVGKS